jgi:MEDS: MEthanogen/methylotroph, DcmR Sensory domain
MPVLECSRCNELYYSAVASTEARCEACGGTIWRVFEHEVSLSRVAELPRKWQPGDHGAVVYKDAEEAGDLCAGFLRDGVSRGDRTLSFVPAALQVAVARRLSPGDREAVESAEPATTYGRAHGNGFDPQAMADTYVEMVERSDAPVRFLAGPDSHSAEAIPLEGWRRFERLAHELVLSLGVIALCVYDARGLPSGFAPVAVEAHPLLAGGGEAMHRNPDFEYQPAG